MSLANLLQAAHHARNQADWPRAIELYRQALSQDSHSAEISHNLGLSYYGAGQYQQAQQNCWQALQLKPQLWQAAIIIAKCQKQQQQIEAADATYSAVLKAVPNNPTALLGRADLALNQFGDAVLARSLVQVLNDDPEHHMDAQLTNLMSRLYDREQSDSATSLTRDVRQFSKTHLQLSDEPYQHAPVTAKTFLKRRPRVGLLSPQFGLSPVYFLTIAGWRHVAQGCDLILFNRGYMQDLATDEFKQLAQQTYAVQHMSAKQLAQTIFDAQIDVLYDLGGWMDPVGLQALSLKPAAQQFKWVGGQSITTGLNCFDGWIGDELQSPQRLQKLYTEPLIQVAGSYAHYSPPNYLPKPSTQKSKIPCVFSNPAKVSRAFLLKLKKIPGDIVFIHRQYQYQRVQERIREILGARAQFVMPKTHEEALNAINRHAVMIDTFPYSSGLTAREAMAMGTTIKVLKVGELFCERHTAGFQ